MTLDALAPLALAVKDQTAIERIIITSLAEYAEPPGPAPRLAGTESLAEILGSHKPGVFRAQISADDLAVLQYTGGTTGTPKGAMLTHGNIFANVVQTEAFMYRNKSRGEARYLLVIPYFHIYAFTVGMMMGIWVGALQLLIPRYDVDQVLAALREFRRFTFRRYRRCLSRS